MADTLVVFEGTLTTASATVTTVPASRALIITEMRLTNKATADASATVLIGTDTNIFPGRTIEKQDSYLQSGIHTVVIAGKTIKASASTATSIDYYISAVGVDV